MRIERFEDIVAWQKAKELAVSVYKILEHSRDYGFNDQLQRAAVSVMNNISEGFERKSNNEFSHFLYISKGSCAEVRSMLHLAVELGKVDETAASQIIGLSEEISKTLSGLIRSISDPKPSSSKPRPTL